MTSKYLLESLHRQTATGEAVGVAESYRGGAVRLVYRRRQNGVITKWRVESAELPAMSRQGPPGQVKRPTPTQTKPQARKGQKRPHSGARQSTRA